MKILKKLAVLLAFVAIMCPAVSRAETKQISKQDSKVEYYVYEYTESGKNLVSSNFLDLPDPSIITENNIVYIQENIAEITLINLGLVSSDDQIVTYGYQPCVGTSRHTPQLRYIIEQHYRIGLPGSGGYCHVTFTYVYQCPYCEEGSYKNVDGPKHAYH